MFTQHNEVHTMYDDNRLDKRLADLLHGDHPIEGDHVQKVVELAELDALFHATNRAGWHRHTGDWDWGAEVTLKDGRRIGDTIWSIEFVDPPDNFTACVDFHKVTKVRLEGQGWNDEELHDIAEEVLIDDITNVYWEQR